MKAPVLICTATLFWFCQPGLLVADEIDETGSGSAAFAGTAVLISGLRSTPDLKIGEVTVSNGSIFDLENPAEDGFLYRLANRLHMTTRPEVIRQQLLFHPGSDYSPQALNESERLLRDDRYIQSASIRPVKVEDGYVDVVVETSDTWTLMPKLSFSRSGGSNNLALGLKEMNLLGSGIGIEALYKSDIDRDYHTLKFTDRNIGGSWYGIHAVYENNSDGHTNILDIGKPFYSVDSRSALGFSWFDNDEIESFYDEGEAYSYYRHRSRRSELMKGWSHGLQDGWTRRFTGGFVFDENLFTADVPQGDVVSVVPGDRRFAYPFIGYELLENAYTKSRNLDQISRVEDVYLGLRFSARVGFANKIFGSDQNAVLYSAGVQQGFGKPGAESLLIASQLAGRFEGGAARNVVLSASASWYKRQSEHRLFFAAVTGSFGSNLDLDQYPSLGGDTGLRGYPLRYQSGDKLAILTLEQRYFTDWYPFRLFHVGGALFFDAGRAWGDSPVPRASNEILTDVGAGLRIGSARSGLGRMVHIDVAVPLNGAADLKSFQVLVSTRKSF
ncbi:MAG TPA: hypothetical protein PKK10_02775 [Woeseiaceae bacterium]|nr:hypothetical protein [Woeseiaceae bacterium]